MKRVAMNLEADVKAGEGQSINTIPIALIGGTGIVRKNTQQSLMLLKRNLIQQFMREIYLQEKVSGVICESAQSLRVGISVGNVGLDIENWCSIHQVCAANVKHRAEFACILHSQQPYAG